MDVVYLLIWALIGYVKSASPSRSLPIPSNRVAGINVTCSAHSLSIAVLMDHSFKGVIFAKDFSQECRSQGLLNPIVKLNLPTSGCGVRLASEHEEPGFESDNNLADEPDSMYYTVTLVIQMDRYLRQITDEERTVKCHLQGEEMKLKSEPMMKAVKETMKKNMRTGRMKSHDFNSDVTELEMQTLDYARAWMEISGESNPDGPPRDHGTVQVGDTMILSVKSTLPENIGWTVVDCFAHDGIGDSSQRLLDESGCPLDELILPALQMSRPRMISNQPPKPVIATNVRNKRTVVKKTGEELVHAQNDEILEEKPAPMMRYQEAVAIFPAFKFPDRDRLHLKCGLQLCKGDCPKVDCNSLQRLPRQLDKDSETARRRSDFDEKIYIQNVLNDTDVSKILDRLEVFNSVEVIAPEIELDEFRTRNRVGLRGPAKPQRNLSFSGDRSFCMSTNKMALAFCVLGVIFIIAVLVALFSLLRSRYDISGKSYYSRSVFSSSTSGSGYGGSKLLLHESPCLGAQRSWQYGRAF